MSLLQNPKVVDFVERVAATAFETFAAAYVLSPTAASARIAAGAAGLSAVKYVAAKVIVWQAAHPE